MDSSFHVNPYFDPQPIGFFIGLKILIVITLTVCIILLYLIFFQSPPQKSKVFKGLLAYHVIVGSLMNLYMSIIAIPIAYVPYIAVTFYGPLTDLNVPTVVQFEILVNIVVAAATGIAPLFYYRMDGLLPKNHFLNKTIIRLAFYGFVYGFCQVTPIPFIAIAYAYQDQQTLKQELLQIHRVYYENYLSDRVIVAQIGWDNPFVILIFLAMLSACCAAVLCILICSLYIWNIVNKSTKFISDKTRKIQKNSLIALVSLMTVLFLGIGIIIPTIIALFSTNSYRQDILNAVILCGISTFPIASLTYIATYRPYRRFIMQKFCWITVPSNENSLWVTERKAYMERRKTVAIPSFVL